MEFEWDAKKEKLNLIKHGVSVLEAQRAFLDPLRVIAVDDAHSKREQRLFCIGRSERGIAASLGAATAFESSGPGIGAKANNFMKKRTARYADDKGEIIGELHRIKDELPSIDELTGKSGRQTKITLALDNDALSFFKREARRRNTSYQRMIRNLVRAYSQAHTARRLAPSAR